MPMDDDDFLKSLQETFQIEAAELLEVISSGLLNLEKTSSPQEQTKIVEAVFRAAHSLKGAARAVNFFEIEGVCQTMEDVFADWKRQQQAPSQAAIDSLHQSLDAASRAITRKAGPSSPSPAPAPLTEPPPSRPQPLPSAAPESQPAPAPRTPIPVTLPSEAPSPSSAETVRISVAKLDARLLEAEEMLTAKLITTQRATDLAGLMEQFESWRKEWLKMQPEVRLLRQSYEPAAASSSSAGARVSRLADFFDWSHDHLRALEHRVAGLTRNAERDQFTVGKLVDDLLDDSKKLLMLPLSTLGVLLPKIVRDICRDQGKEADFTIRGEEIEIDKRILEEMKDPLVHLLRNAVDHGIEKPAERRRAGKPPRATINLAVSPLNGSKVEISLTDDGAGIDPAKVKASAVKHGHLTQEEADQLDHWSALNLIFRSDVSTSPIITELSGRGLGLAIVREKAEKLGGQVEVESRLGVGTTFRITLPVALATFRGILVETTGRQFVIPTTQVERVGRFKPSEIQSVKNRETLSLDGRVISLVWLSEVLEIGAPTAGEESATGTPMVLLGSGDQRMAFAVEAIHSEHEVLVRRLGKPLSRVRNISGATVLGSGQVVPILNVSDLLKSAKKTSRATPRSDAHTTPETQTKSILVAEDSITSRMLLKGILESSGYRVKTAVDGLEAFTALRAEHFDLLVSDVEMPRLNGFDLTARVRADRKLAELPVILVTAMEKREDRERGIEVGANAYLIKSNFDQSNLLEAVRRLI